MNLRDLHSSQPLSDADFAAIRARVKSRIREPRGVPLLFRFAFAMLLVVAFVPYVQHRAPQVPVTVKQVALVSGGAAGFSPPNVPAVVKPVANPPGGLKPAAPRRRPAKSRRRPIASAPAPALARIEYQTADPEIRIIWIVNKESS